MNFFKEAKLKKIVLSIIFLNISFVSAQEISEIMYDPVGSNTGKSWVEVYNNTSNSINLINYKFFEGNVNHSISIYSSYTNPGGNVILPGEYAVIVDNPVTFLSAYSNFSGKLFDSSFSLSQTGDTLSLKTGSPLTVIFTTNYVSNVNANGTGGSLNYINNSWQVYEQTPGASSTLIFVSNSNDNSTTTTNSTTTSTTTTNNNTGSANSLVSSYAAYTSSGSNRFILGDLKMLVPREINTVVGAETEFFVKNIDSKNTIIKANTYWSFGDGSEGIGSTTTHRYQNVGVYNAFIESEVSNSYGVDRIIVKVENPNIEISDVQDNYVELYNKSDIELNIGRFTIASDQGLYQLSRMFIINPNSKVKVDGRVLGFSKLTNVRLLSAYNTFVTKYENKSLLFQSNILENIKSTSTAILLENATNTSLIKNKIIYKNKLKVVSNGLAPKQNPKLTNVTYKKEENKEEVKEIASDVGEKGSTNFVKKWLYWIYE